MHVRFGIIYHPVRLKPDQSGTDLVTATTLVLPDGKRQNTVDLAQHTAAETHRRKAQHFFSRPGRPIHTLISQGRRFKLRTQTADGAKQTDIIHRTYVFIGKSANQLMALLQNDTERIRLERQLKRLEVQVARTKRALQRREDAITQDFVDANPKVVRNVPYSPTEMYQTLIRASQHNRQQKQSQQNDKPGLVNKVFEFRTWANRSREFLRAAAASIINF